MNVWHPSQGLESSLEVAWNIKPHSCSIDLYMEIRELLCIGTSNIIVWLGFLLCVVTEVVRENSL